MLVSDGVCWLPRFNHGCLDLVPVFGSQAAHSPDAEKQANAKLLVACFLPDTVTGTPARP